MRNEKANPKLIQINLQTILMTFQPSFVILSQAHSVTCLKYRKLSFQDLLEITV